MASLRRAILCLPCWYHKRHSYDDGQAFLLVCQRLADDVLHHAVAGHHQAVLFQVMQEFSKDVDPFRGNL